MTAADATGSPIAGRYDVERTLGKGAFGRTLLAVDRETGARVALKLLDARRAEDLKTFELFEREASVLRSLRHQGVPQVHASLRGRWEGADVALLVMEYIEGPSLERVIEERRHLDPAQVMDLMIEMLGILEYLHSRVPPVLHRDIKPGNIIVRQGGLPALVDFGAVRQVFQAPGESGSTVVGTYGYMPYEQYMGQASPASDLFALAATFLHLLTGRPPASFMTGEGRIEVPENLPGDARLRVVLVRMLKPSPAERFQSAREVRQALLAASAAAPEGIGALVPVRSAATALTLPELPPAPRALEGKALELYQGESWSMWQLMDTRAKTMDEDGPNLWDMLLFGLFSLLTVGILPGIFGSMARARRRRLKRFVTDGLPGSAEIVSIVLEDTAFGEKIARVGYEFEAGGRRRRDTDQVLPLIADRWRVGDRVPLLYLPDRDYDSVLIAMS